MSDSFVLLQTNIIMGVILNLVLYGFASAIPESVRKSQRMWALAGLFITLSWVALALRSMMPAVWAAAMANATLGFGLAYYGCALREFIARPIAIWVPLMCASAYAIFTVVAFEFELPAVSRFIGISLGTVVIFIWVCKLAFLARPFARYGASFTVGILLSLIFLQLVRVAYFALNSEKSFNELLFSPGAQIITVAATVSFALLTFSFSMMSSERLTTQLKRLVRFDNLTLCLNRNPWRSGFEHAFEAKSAQALMLFDLDHFKAVNDDFGHAAGDQVLKDVAQCASLRFGETVGRLGGEEFTVYFAASDLSDAHRQAEAFRLAIHDRVIEHAGMLIRVSVSVGLVWLDNYQNVKEALAAADRAMYQAKHAGRNQCVLLAANESALS
jgi:diguanylate cyclase (GGDEF)-like protein